MQFPYLDAQESVPEVSRSSLPMKFNAHTHKKRALTSNLKEKLKLPKLE